MEHLRYLEENRIPVSEWEKATTTAAQELVEILRKRGCPFYDAKAALAKAEQILEEALERTKV